MIRPASLDLPAGQAFEERLATWLDAGDDLGLDPLWKGARLQVREFILRPAKRVRPTLLALGWMLGRGEQRWAEVPQEVEQFGVGLELLHAFMLIHDDVADRAETRRGGPSLHRQLGEGKLGEDLAIVAGDHLYARALEAMFAGSPQAGRYMLEVCRQTAAGQHLDLVFSRAPLSEVTLFRTLKVADLKTARYGFVAPLVCGAMMGGAEASLLEQLKRAGRHAGLAYQLRDDLMGLFGDERVTGKAGGGDYLEGKRTFPVIAAWTRADAPRRQQLEALWEAPEEEKLEQARGLVRSLGGLASTQRVIDVRTRAARRVLQGLAPSPAVSALDGMIAGLARRST
ncbi:MAG: polyprenyl synthetase family protein [Myxococcota bacterium]|nr:polyprenyl synthetase family protein [Myxococcota bacterium]